MFTYNVWRFIPAFWLLRDRSPISYFKLGRRVHKFDKCIQIKVVAFQYTEEVDSAER